MRRRYSAKTELPVVRKALETGYAAVVARRYNLSSQHG